MLDVSEFSFVLLSLLTMIPLGFFMPCSNCCICPSYYTTALSSGELASFTQVSGTWAWNTNGFQTSDDNALIVTGATAPASTGTVRATFNTTALAVGDSVRVIGCYVDSSNYLAGEIERTTTVSGGYALQLRIISVEGGVETELATREVKTWSNLGASAPSAVPTLSWDGERAELCNGTGVHLFVDYTPPSGTYQAGAATRSIGGSVRLTALSWTGTKLTNSNCTVACSTCVSGSVCGISPGPCRIQVEMDGVADLACDNCNRLNATFICNRDNVFHTLNASGWSAPEFVYPDNCGAPAANVLSVYALGSGGSARYNVALQQGAAGSSLFSVLQSSCTMDNESWPAGNNFNGLCDPAAATCFVTALVG